MHADVRLPVAQASDVGVVEPQSVGRSAHVGDELTRMRDVQVAHCRRQHSDVARTLVRAEDEAANRHGWHQTRRHGVSALRRERPNCI